jgi:hypothetical protein
MTENPDLEDRILVDGRIHKSEVKIVTFAGDSSPRITIHTDSETSTPFQRPGHKDTYTNTILFKGLLIT